jgi:hypothetical protein
MSRFNGEGQLDSWTLITLAHPMGLVSVCEPADSVCSVITMHPKKKGAGDLPRPLEVSIIGAHPPFWPLLF